MMGWLSSRMLEITMRYSAAPALPARKSAACHQLVLAIVLSSALQMPSVEDMFDSRQYIPPSSAVKQTQEHTY
jgi:hypothetical protein